MDAFTISYIVLWALVILETVAMVVLMRAVGNLYLGSRHAIERDGLAIGSKAPEFDGQLLDGAPFSSRNLGGRWRLLLFALPTCQICRRLLPEIRRLSDELGDEVAVRVLVRGTPALATAFASGYPANIVSVSESVAARGFKVRVSPYATVIDPSGEVRAKGLVDRIEHVEHMLHEAGIHNEITARHEAERDRGHEHA